MSMKPVVEKTSIVLMGGWNRALMTPQWFADNIFREEAEAVALSIDFGVHSAFDFDGVRFSVNATSTRVLFKAKSKDAAALAAMEEAARRLLRLVGDTPMSAVGVNVGFSIENRTDLNEALIPMLLESAFEKSKARLKGATLSRTVLVDDVTVNVVLFLADKKLTVEANNHIPVSTAKSAEETLAKNTLAVCRSRSLVLLDQLYRLKEE